MKNERINNINSHSHGWGNLSRKIGSIDKPIMLSDHFINELPPKTLKVINESLSRKSSFCAYEDDPDYKYMRSSLSSGLMVGAHYSPFLYGISINPHQEFLNHIPKNLGFSMSFPDYAIRAIKVNEDQHSFSEINGFRNYHASIGKRSACSVLMTLDELGKYIDTDRIHPKLVKLLIDNEALTMTKKILGGNVFLRIPVDEKFIENNEIPLFLVSGQKGSRMLQIIQFHQHPLLERVVNTQIDVIKSLSPGKIPAVGVTSANVSSHPEIISEKDMLNFYSKGYRSTLMPYVYNKKQPLSDTHSRVGSFPILEVGKSETLTLVRAGNLPPRVTSELISKLDLKVNKSADMTPHSYQYTIKSGSTGGIPKIY